MPPFGEHNFEQNWVPFCAEFHLVGPDLGIDVDGNFDPNLLNPFVQGPPMTRTLIRVEAETHKNKRHDSMPTFPRPRKFWNRNKHCHAVSPLFFRLAPESQR